MIDPISDDVQHPLVILLRDILQHYRAACFVDTEHHHTVLASALRRELHTQLYTASLDLQPFMLSSCQVIPQLGPNTLAMFLNNQGLTPACFMSEPPSFFDSVLVPADVEGSGFIWYFSDDLTISNIYYLLAHVYGHLMLGHVRKGDRYSHYDVLSALQSPSGPVRRWDRTVQQLQHFWFQPLEVIHHVQEDSREWMLDGAAQAFEKLCANQTDDITLLIQAVVSHYNTRLLQVDFDLARDAQLFPHQRRGAAELAVRLQKLGVALLADSVGLGKTRTTATLIKILLQHKLIKQAAILTPRKLAYNWQEELAKLHLTIGVPGDEKADVLIVNKDIFKRIDPREAREQVRNCDLLVIEEAHQDTRNSKNKFYRNLREVALDKYGLLVTATPWNNRRGDIFTMLYPFATNTRGKERPAQAFSCFSQAFRLGLQEFEQNTQVFRQVYSLTALQRTRRQLRESGDNAVFYAPRRPHLVEIVYTPEQRRAFATLLSKIEELRLPYFNPIRYLPSTDTSANHLSGIHRFMLLKRAESSMRAFSQSLIAFGSKAALLREELEKIEDNNVAIAHWLRQRYNVGEQEGEDELNWEATSDLMPHTKTRSKKVLQSIDIAERAGQLCSFKYTLIEDCFHDEKIVRSIQQDFNSLFAKDPKLDSILAQVIASISYGYKVLCISQFADTAYTVYQHLLNHPFSRQKGVGLVMGSTNEAGSATQINGHIASREQVLSRFAPNSWSTQEKKRTKKGKEGKEREQLPTAIDIVVGTDTLSVGQNLQDARVLVNLDLCWNPMLHEQRIGRIDRPRHHSDSSPLDIFYFLNLDLIESELNLRETIEKRLSATYQDTAFDDEVFPGYFEMIEQFHRLRQAQEPEKTFIAEADMILEAIVEKSGQPSDVKLPDNEQEIAALLRLQEHAQLDSSKELLPERQFVNVGYIPLTDQYGLMRSDLPEAVVIAEVEFRLVDRTQRLVGQPIYRRFSLSLHSSREGTEGNTSIIAENESIVPIANGLLSESTTVTLSKRNISHLTSLLLKLEEDVQQEQRAIEIFQKRANRYRHILQTTDVDQHTVLEKDKQVSAVHARLSCIRFLI